MAFDRRPILAVFADKYDVRDFVTRRVGDQVLPELYALYDQAKTVDLASLPHEFVCKPTHGAGAGILCWQRGTDRLPRRARHQAWDFFSVSPQNMEPARVKTLFEQWCTQSYEFGPNKLPEWAYGQLKARVLVEELLVDSVGALPVEYKFFMFDGKCRLVQIHSNRFNGHTCDLLRPNWEPFAARMSYFETSENLPDKPSNFSEMVEIAETLSAESDFVRVDLYDVGGVTKFSEMTNYPRAGQLEFTPASFNDELGAFWNLWDQKPRGS